MYCCNSSPNPFPTQICSPPKRQELVGWERLLRQSTPPPGILVRCNLLTVVDVRVTCPVSLICVKPILYRHEQHVWPLSDNVSASCSLITNKRALKTFIQPLTLPELVRCRWQLQQHCVNELKPASPIILPADTLSEKHLPDNSSHGYIWWRLTQFSKEFF